MIELASALLSVMGLLLLLVAPGLSWSFLLVQDNSVRWPNRLLTSIGLSLVVMPLAAFWLNLAAGLPLTGLTLSLLALGLGLAPLAYLGWKRWAR